MKYAWIIDVDHIADSGAEPGTNSNAVGLQGPRNASADLLAQLEAGQGEDFQMFDDDNNLYYEGRIVGDYSCFEPLDDFGMPNAGCTRIDVGGVTV